MQLLPVMLTVKLQILVLPEASVAVNWTMCSPMSNAEPDVALATGVMGSMELSVTLAAGQNAIPVGRPGLVKFITSSGHIN